MRQSTRSEDNGKYKALAEEPSRRLSFRQFLIRYPIFIFAFGPPIFRSSAGIDATKGVIDIWAFLQVGLLSSVAARAIWRLAAAESILLPKQIRSILRLAFFLGALFLASAIYSPSRPVSAAYAILYFLTLICVAEFVVDVYRNPPDWMQCLYYLRLIALLLLALDFVVLPFEPNLVFTAIPGYGIRLSGGAMGPVALICPMIAIISAYSFLYSMEPRGRSAFLFLVGLAGSFGTQSRGCELALLLSLCILGLRWANRRRRAMYLFISGFIVFILLSGLVVGAIGGERIWNLVNRGEDAEAIATASGRTQMWHFVFQYCLAHPQGMGYVAGFRILFKQYYTLGLILETQNIGAAHNSFLQVLADAGWLALAVYLIMLVKIVRIAWHYSKRKTNLKFALGSGACHTIECSLLMLIYCLGAGMNASDFVIPLRTLFYWQNIIIAIILGIAALEIAASRAQKHLLAEQNLNAIRTRT